MALGKAATPHRQEQVQAPPDAVVPVPGTILVPAAAPAAGAAAALPAAPAAVAMVAAGAAGAAGAAAAPPAIGLVVPVPFWAMAWDLNVAWVLSAVGLMEKVIPFPQ